MSEPTPRYPGLVPDQPPPPPERPAPQPAVTPRKRRVLPTPLIGGVVGTLVGGIVGAAMTIAALFAFGVLPGSGQTTPSTTTLPQLASIDETLPSDAVTAIANRAIPSIVTVEVGNGDGRVDLATASGSGVV